MMKKSVLTLLLPLTMVTLAHANDTDSACKNVAPSASEIVKKERSDNIAPGIMKATKAGCDSDVHDNFKSELTDSQDALLNPRLPGTLLAIR